MVNIRLLVTGGNFRASLHGNVFEKFVAHMVFADKVRVSFNEDTYQGIDRGWLG